jgi:RNA polymerase sigma-70 factor (ECF subfamily)
MFLGHEILLAFDRDTRAGPSRITLQPLVIRSGARDVKLVQAMKKPTTITPYVVAHQPPGLPMSQDQLAQLVRQVAQNLDREAFSTLFDLLAPKVKALLMRRGLDAAAAEDLMQDVMLSVWTKAGLYDPTRGSLQGWVFTIARNALIDRIRRKKPDISIDMIEWEPVDESENSEQRMLREERAAKLQSALKTIAAEQLSVLQLAFQEELTQTEIAARLSLPLGTVKSRMRLAYAHLRSAMEQSS